MQRRQIESSQGSIVLNADLFLSLVCAGRSVDLCYETESDRNAWKILLDTLCTKEHGQLTGVEAITPVYSSSEASIPYSLHCTTAPSEVAVTPSMTPATASPAKPLTATAIPKAAPKTPSVKGAADRTKMTPARASPSGPGTLPKTAPVPVAAPKIPEIQPAPASTAYPLSHSTPPECTDCTLEWSVLYSTIGPEIVPKHVIGSILKLERVVDETENSYATEDCSVEYGEDKIDFSVLMKDRGTRPKSPVLSRKESTFAGVAR